MGTISKKKWLQKKRRERNHKKRSGRVLCDYTRTKQTASSAPRTVEDSCYLLTYYNADQEDVLQSADLFVIQAPMLYRTLLSLAIRNGFDQHDQLQLQLASRAALETQELHTCLEALAIAAAREGACWVDEDGFPTAHEFHYRMPTEEDEMSEKDRHEMILRFNRLAEDWERLKEEGMSGQGCYFLHRPEWDRYCRSSANEAVLRIEIQDDYKDEVSQEMAGWIIKKNVGDGFHIPVFLEPEHLFKYHATPEGVA